jgi:hypothetical protein
MAFLGWRSYRDSFQTIKVTARKPFTLTLYAPLSTDESNAYDKSKVFFVATDTETFRVKKGVYVYAVSGGSDYQEFSEQISVGAKPVNLSMPQLNYTPAKLASMLAKERPAIESVINNAYPSQMKIYSIQGGKLYGNGQWYGARLVPNDPRTYDTLRIILKKEGPTWQIVTKPPEIVISQPVYPQIPAYILSDLNNFDGN